MSDTHNTDDPPDLTDEELTAMLRDLKWHDKFVDSPEWTTVRAVTLIGMYWTAKRKLERLQRDPDAEEEMNT